MYNYFNLTQVKDGISSQKARNNRTKTFVYNLLSNRELKKSGKFFCDRCDFTADLRSIVTVHIIKTHLKPYGCISCNYFSGSDYRVLDHLMVKHVGILPYQCARCEKAYTTQQGLSRHFTRNHHFGMEELRPNRRRIYMPDAVMRLPETGEPLATCRICRIRFPHDGELLDHVLLNHCRSHPNDNDNPSWVRCNKNNDKLYIMEP